MTSSRPYRIVVLALVALFVSSSASAEPLHDAAEVGDIEQVTRLVTEGANVNAEDPDGLTPLHWAALKGHEGVAELLIAEGANVNAKDSEGLTPLHWAARQGHEGAAEVLKAAEAPD